LINLEKAFLEPKFWDDTQNAQKVTQELASKKKEFELIQSWQTRISDFAEMLDLLQELSEEEQKELLDTLRARI
jgi:hypothetical protein